MELLSSIGNFIATHPIELIAAAINFLWVYLEYKASMWLWPVGIVLPLFYIYLSIEAQYYGNVVINSYYIATSIYGWILWLRHRNQEEAFSILSIKPRAFIISLMAVLFAFLPSMLLLKAYTDSLIPWADATATLISFAGMIWLAKRYRQHWLCWIVANVLSTAIFYSAGDQVSAFVFLVNAVVAILGYFKWRTMYRAQNANQQ